MKLQLKRFDMSSIADDKIVVLIGKRDTGKSFLARDLLWYHKNIPIGTVISATESANKFYSFMVPNMFIHEQFNSKIVDNVLKRQKLVMRKCRKEIKHKGETDIDPRAFLILDDCLADAKSWVRDPSIQSIFLNGRHFKLLFVLTCQFPLGIPPTLRTNIDYVFILRENIYTNRKRIYENYAGMFPTFEVFCQVLDSTTEDYECLVIHNNAKSNKLEDQVFWYKADPHPNFRVGDPHFWAIQDEMGSDESDDGEELCDMNSFKKKKGPIINVKKSMI